MNTIIPHSRPSIGEDEALAAGDTVRSEQIAQGGKVSKFEEKLAEFVGVKGAVATNSGTSALQLGLMAMGVGADDDVVLPSFVCSAPLNAIYAAGANPKISEIEPESYNISLENLKDAKTKNTKAVIVPHMFGSPADLEKLESAGIPIVEDCAQSIGALYGKKKAGSVGRFGICSFYANKMMACGEGGVILSDDDDILSFARDRRDYDEKDDYKVRFNCKMTDIQAAIGLVQLGKLESFIARRKQIAARYDSGLKGLDIELPRGEFDHIYYRYVIKTRKDPEEVISAMLDKGVLCARPIFKPLHRYLEIRSGYRKTDEAYSTAVSIPIYPSLTDMEQGMVIGALKEVISDK